MAKKKDKYQWQIGAPLPVLDEHSQTKHAVIADYLKQYAQVYMSNTTIERLPLTIVDGFAGGGLYRDALSNEKLLGSPFLILQAITEAQAELNIGRQKPRYIDAEYHYIEKVDPHFKFLEGEFQASTYKPYLNSKIFLHHAEFAQVANKVIDRIKKRNRAQRSIFILDQYAYKDVPFPIIQTILNDLVGSEVILTFSYDSLQGYIADTTVNRKALENIGLAKYIDWNRLATFKEAGNWQAAIQEQLANAIYQASGAKHITLFFVSPKTGWKYWLVHLSKVYRARDVMMKIHWKHANTSKAFSHHLSDGLFSLGYQATETPGQDSFDLVSDFDFSEEAQARCIDALAVDIPRYICNSDESLSFSELTEELGSFTAASEFQIKLALQTALERKEISVITDSGGSRRQASQIKGSDIIGYCQNQLFSK